MDRQVMSGGTSLDVARASRLRVGPSLIAQAQDSDLFFGQPHRSWTSASISRNHSYRDGIFPGRVVQTRNPHESAQATLRE